MKSTIRYPKKHELMVKSIKEDLKLFSTYKEFLSFCAAIALHRNSIDDISVDTIIWSNQQIKIDIFNKGEFDRSLMDLIALKYSDDISILNGDRDEEIFNIFELFVANGLEIYSREIHSVINKNALSDLLLFIDKSKNNNEGSKLSEFTDFLT